MNHLNKLTSNSRGVKKERKSRELNTLPLPHPKSRSILMDGLWWVSNICQAKWVEKWTSSLGLQVSLAFWKIMVYICACYSNQVCESGDSRYTGSKRVLSFLLTTISHSSLNSWVEHKWITAIASCWSTAWNHCTWNQVCSKKAHQQFRGRVWERKEVKLMKNAKKTPHIHDVNSKKHKEYKERAIRLYTLWLAAIFYQCNGKS